MIPTFWLIVMLNLFN